MINVSNVSLKIILHEVHSHSESKIYILPQILKIKLKQTQPSGTMVESMLDYVSILQIGSMLIL